MRALVIGDLHGHLDSYARLLTDAGLTNADGDWTGGDATLWLMGDLFDRGPAGIDCLRLTRRLQRQAAAVGGKVDCLLGNHEIMLLAARDFSAAGADPGGLFMQAWRENGGRPRDLELMTDEEADWLRCRPALARLGDYLLLHADATCYLHYGFNPEQINGKLGELLRKPEPGPWMNVIRGFSEHRAFCAAGDGRQLAERLLQLLGGRQLVHGHTPISLCTDLPAEQVTEAWVYADGLCCNVDAGIFLGSPGFVHELAPELPERRADGRE